MTDYLVCWDFSKDDPPPGSFYRVLDQEYSGQFRFLQRSIILAEDSEIAHQLCYLAQRCGAVRVAMFEVVRDRWDSASRQAAEQAVETMFTRRLARQGKRGAAG